MKKKNLMSMKAWIMLKMFSVSGSLKQQNKTYQFVRKGECDKRRILCSLQTGMTMALQAQPTLCSLCSSLCCRWIPVQGRARLFTLIPRHTDGKAC